MTKYIKAITLAVFLTIIPTLILWLVFVLKPTSFWSIPLKQDGMATIVSNYDGPLYLAVAKTLYNPDALKAFEFNLPVEYYAAHFPLYPLFIRAFSGFFGYPYSMLFVTVVSSIFAIFYFRLLAGEITEKNADFLTFVFSIFPARFLIVRSVGSPEPLFIGAIIASIYYFRKNKYLLSGIFGGIAVATKSPGILLFLAYGLEVLFETIKNLTSRNSKDYKITNIFNYTPLIIMPLSLLAVFFLYGKTFGNFFAYFNSGDNIHLFFPPFQIFNSTAPWVGTFWLEEIIFIYLALIYGFIKLISDKEKGMTVFTGVFLATLLFVSHRDLLRYSLPIIPFVLIALRETLANNKFKMAFLAIIIPIFLYSITFISQNTMPISNWLPLL